MINGNKSTVFRNVRNNSSLKGMEYWADNPVARMMGLNPDNLAIDVHPMPVKRGGRR